MKRIIGILLVFILIGGIFLGVTLNSQSSGYTLTVNDLSRTGLKENSVVTITAPEKAGYTFSNWEIVSGDAVLEDPTSMTTTFSMPGGDVNIKANYVLIEQAANAPLLGEGMIPVNWDDTNSEWIETNEENWDYNYYSVAEEASNGTVEGNGSGKWANAITEDGSMWVWIPRYTYKITSGEHQSAVSWNSDLYDEANDIAGKIEIKFSDGTTDDTSNGYISHPAFSFGEDELEGFWVAKYEASRIDRTNNNYGSSDIIVSKPDVLSSYGSSVSNIYECAYNMNRDLDSHLMRNSEWGAVAYLTNARGRIPYINNRSKTGWSGESEEAEQGDTRHLWNTVAGVKASTTHNVYGIYDMNGGALEYVSAYYTGGSSTYLAEDISNKTYAGSLYKNRYTKYVDQYSVVYDSGKIGDAMYETSSEYYDESINSGLKNASWDGDTSHSIYSEGPVIIRGGAYNSSATAGIFSFWRGPGDRTYVGFRPVLIGFNNVDTYTISYNANGGTGAPNAQPKTEGVAITLSTTKPTRDGHEFLGWSTSSTATKVEFQAGATFEIDSSMTLYAAWELNSVITINLNAEEETTKSIIVKTSGETQISWGDGTVETVGTSSEAELTLTHTYATAGNYIIKIINNVVTYLSCTNSDISRIDISENTVLEYLNVSDNSITSLDVSNNINLTEIYCSNNELAILDVSNNTELVILSCYSNYLTEDLDLTNNTKLINLQCGNTGITGLELYDNTELLYLDCNSNSLSALDLSNNLKINELYCGGNELSILDISPNEKLTKVCCTQETLETLYINEAQNTNMTITDETSCCSSGSITTTNTLHKYSDTTVVAGSTTDFNTPLLGEGMTPVNWDDTNSEWVETDEENWDYNYESVAETASNGTVVGNGSGKWANAITEDGSMWVWIPRYTYKIVSGYHQSAVSWNSDLYDEANDTAGKIEIKFSVGTVDDTSGNYILHPAFTFGEDELEGFWVAKYEASRNDATDSSEGTETTVTIKPGVVSWRNLSVSNMYDYAYNMNRDLDSHLMKNSEWGAVAYLTNAIGRTPYINNSSTYITGNAGGSQDVASAEGVTNAWNTAAGVKASTTHNVYGIYDMSGGAFEYIAAYYTYGNSEFLESDVTNKAHAGMLYSNKETKYVEKYNAIYSNAVIGDAVYETSSGNPGAFGWDDDYVSAPYLAEPVFARGGDYASLSNGGIFYVYNYDGSIKANRSFRPVLAGFNNIDTYTIKYEANGGSGAPDSQTKTEGVALTLSSTEPIRNGYNFLGWSTDSTATEAEFLSGGSFTVDANVTLYAVWGFLSNSPVLGTGMTPVNWDDTNSEWVETDVANWDYNYESVAEEESNGTVIGNGSGKWANAKTTDGSMWVWIPRYTYKIVSGEHQAAVSWNSDLYDEANDTAGKIEIKFSNGTDDDTNDSYIAHPAFTFGDNELEGFWVAKYEASRSDATENSVGESGMLSSKANVRSWRNLSVSSMYEVSYNYNRNLDSHLMKNNEWGAVAYLTNAIGRIPYINNSGDRITGNAGDTQDAAEVSGSSNAWNTISGVKGSSTHNIYGVYDLSGGSCEVVSSYYANGNSTYLSEDISNGLYAGNLYLNRDTKYVDLYNTVYDNSMLGDAVYETSGDSLEYNSWDGDSSNVVSSSYPVFIRSGSVADGAMTGIFYFDITSGVEAFWIGFRPVLTGFNNLSTYTISFDENGGQGAPQSQYKTEGLPLTLSYVEPTRDGYEFLGWSTDSTATEAEYLSGGTFEIDEDTSLYAVWKDTIAPVISNLTNSSNEEWCTELTLSWNIEENGSGLASVQWSLNNADFDASTSTGTFAVESDGSYSITRSNERNDIIYIRAIDNAGNISDVVSTTLKIDRTAPVITNFTNSSNGEWCTELTLAWDITEEGSGIKTVQSSNNDENFTSPITLSSSEWYGLTRSNSRNDIAYIRVVDTAGNISDVVNTTLKIDNTVPTGSYEVSEITDTAITFKATATDAHSGLLRLRVGGWWGQSSWSTYHTNSNIIDNPTNGTEYTMTINLADIVNTLDGTKASGGCTYYFSVMAYDNMNNGRTLGHYTYNYVAPTYTVTYDANGGNGVPNAQTKVEGVDLTLSYVEPTRDGYEFLGWSENADATEATYTAGSTFTLDKDTTLYAVYKDNIAPEIYDFVNTSNGEWCTELTLSWKIKEEGSGISGVQWSLDGSDFETSTSTGYYGQSEQLGIYRDWERDDVVYIRAIDNAGNISNVVSTAMRIDRTAPVITNFTNSSNEEWCKSATVSWEINENYEIDRVEWSNNDENFTSPITLGSSEMYGLTRSNNRDDTVYIRVIDKAGNISDVVQTKLRIDNYAPHGSSSIASVTDTTITFNASATDTWSGLSYLRVGAWWGQSNWKEFNAESKVFNIVNGTEYTMSVNFADIVNTVDGTLAPDPSNCTYYFDVTAYDKLNNMRRIGYYTYEKEASMYTVDYNANGGTGAPSSQTKTQGISITIPNDEPTRTGYDFLGWSTSSTATSATYQPGATFTTDANTTLYAVWQLKTIKVTFHRNTSESDTTTATQTFTYGTSGQSFSNKNWTRAGYTLLGWSLTENATASTYSVLSPVSDLWIDTYSSEVNLYAVWKDTIAPVISEITNSSNGEWCKQLTLSWTILEEGSGVDKVQWSLDGADFEASTSKGNYIESEKYGITRSNTRNDVVHVRVIDKAGNISNVVSTTMKIDNVAPVISSITNSSNGNLCPSLTLSWSITENHSGISGVQWSLNNSNFETSTNTGYYSESEQLGIYRDWTRNDTVYVRVIDNVGNISNVVSTKMNINSQHTGATQANGGKCTICNEVYQVYVSYDANGGSGAPATQAKTIGTALTLSSTKPTRTGYTFEGWNASSTATSATYTSGASYTTDSSTKLYAVWKANTYTVTLNNQSATTAGTASVTATYGSAMPGITKPAKAYTVTYNHNASGVANTTATATYTFGGYYTATSGGGTQYYKADGTSARNWDKTVATTLYAKWTGGSVTLPTPTRTGYTFGGWYGESGCTNKVGDGGASYTPTKTITLYAKWTAKTVKVTFYRNQSSTDTQIATQTFTYGASNQSFSAKGWSKSNSHLLGWNETRSATAKQYSTLSGVTNDWINTKSPDVNLYAVWEAHKGGTATWNAKPVCSVCGAQYGTKLLPKLPTGLTPVNWDGNTWVTTTTANWDYNYTEASAWSSSVGSSAYAVGGNGTAKWANAMLDADGDGTLESLYVWIPRFTYKVVEGNEISWNADTAGTARTYIKLSNGTTDDTSDSYVIHPAFNPGGTAITGFWVGKYETTRSNATASWTGDTVIATVQPGKLPWSSITPNDAYTYAKNVSSTAGSHMMKDSEWGAVAYFTSAIGRIPYVNPTQANGYAGPTQSSANKEVGASDVYFWNTEYGARASTTHNVYGIYDMAGGKHEFVAAVKNTAVASQITNLKNADAKYVDKYTTDYPPVESGNIGWDSDTKGTIWGDPPAFTRGGYRGGDGQGIFNGYKSPTVSNGVTSSSYTFRMALFGQAI